MWTYVYVFYCKFTLYVYLCIYVYEYVNVFICMYFNGCVRMSEYIYICLAMCMHVQFLCVHTYIHIYIYIYIYMLTLTWTLFLEYCMCILNTWILYIYIMTVKRVHFDLLITEKRVFLWHIQYSRKSVQVKTYCMFFVLEMLLIWP